MFEQIMLCMYGVHTSLILTLYLDLVKVVDEKKKSGRRSDEENSDVDCVDFSTESME